MLVYIPAPWSTWDMGLRQWYPEKNNIGLRNNILNHQPRIVLINIIQHYSTLFKQHKEGMNHWPLDPLVMMGMCAKSKSMSRDFGWGSFFHLERCRSKYSTTTWKKSIGPCLKTNTSNRKTTNTESNGWRLSDLSGNQITPIFLKKNGLP